MKNMKFWRTALVATLVLTVMLSVTGGTIAWFTDEVKSANNVIKSGTLDVQLHMADKHDAAEWKNVEDADAGPIFNYDKWEPGYTQVKYVKVVNNGNLAFKYQIKVNPTVAKTGTDAYLADKIDVYYTVVEDGFTAPGSATDVKAWTYAGTVTDMMNVKADAVHGVMLDDQKEAKVAIALHMREDAGNEYQNLSVGEGFVIELLATQYTHETDSFNDLYDVGATYGNYPVAKVTKIPHDNLETNIFWPQNSSVTTRPLDVAYRFETTETPEEAAENDFAEWHGDFVITLDRDVSPMQFGIAGQYGSYPWIGIDVDEGLVEHLGENGVIPAGTPLRLLQTAGINFNYVALCSDVEKFDCGAYAIDEAIKGAKMTVELRLYEPKNDANNTNNETETGEYIVLESYSYTFGE